MESRDLSVPNVGHEISPKALVDQGFLLKAGSASLMDIRIRQQCLPIGGSPKCSRV